MHEKTQEMESVIMPQRCPRPRPLSLVPLYPKLSRGGFLIVDDYGIDMCRKAIHDYRDREGIQDEIIPIDDVSVYWRKR